MAAMGARERAPREAVRLRLVSAAVLLVALVAAVWAAGSGAATPSAFQRAIVVQEERSDALLRRAEIVGTAVGETETGAPEIVVLATGPVSVPNALEGVPVEVEATGAIAPIKAAPRKGTVGTGPTGRFARPVPIGVSTGNAGECSAGTIGARVEDASGNVYALSNNHVYALENQAAIGSQVLQPGLYDTGCAYSAANLLGTLADYEPIVFSKAASNVVDAAIASTTTASLGNATPSNGYGAPSSVAQTAVVGQPVQKYGRTTSLTTGSVSAVNGIVEVAYGAGTARFVDQVIVQSTKPFLKSGDSGSLLVTRDAAADPVGLLFASGASGKYAIANPIGAVLGAFGVSVDGK